MRDSTADPREDVVRTRGAQDHEAGVFTKLIFWRAKRRYGHVPLSTQILTRLPTSISAVASDTTLGLLAWNSFRLALHPCAIRSHQAHCAPGPPQVLV